MEHLMAKEDLADQRAAEDNSESDRGKVLDQIKTRKK